jgi:hypothetical protein
LVVVSVVLVALFVLPETDLIRTRVQRQLKAATGQEVLLGSLKVSPSFPHLVQLTLEGFSVQTPRGKPLFSADRVVLVPGLLKLLHGEIHIESITIDRFKASLIRSPEGKVGSPFIPIPSATLAAKSFPETAPGPVRKIEGRTPQPTRPVEHEAPFKWSVKKVTLTRGTIDWVDLAVEPGRRIVIPIRDVEGRLEQAGRPNRLAVKMSARVGGSKGEGSRVTLEGTVCLVGDLLRPQQVRMKAEARKLDLKPFHGYLVRFGPWVEKIDLTGLRAELTWDKGSSPLVLFRGSARGKGNEKDRIDVEGKITGGPDFSGVARVEWKADTDRLPLRFFDEHLPADFPLDPAYGVIKGGVAGTWEGGDRWRAKASFILEEGIPRGRYKALAKKVRVWGQALLKPKGIFIEKLEVSGPKRIVAVNGGISDPYSGDPRLDLSGEVNLSPRWLKAFHLKLPRSVTLKGVMPVRGDVRGKPDDLWFDVKGDLTKASVSRPPYLEKKSGPKGRFTAKGVFRKKPRKGGKGRILDAVVAIDSAGTAIRFSPGSRWLPRSIVHLGARIIVTKRGTDLKDTIVALSRGSAAREIFRITGEIGGVGSSRPRVRGSVEAYVDRETLTLMGLGSRRATSIRGSSRLKAHFRGPATKLNWSIDLPLRNLDITVGREFRKPGGIAGSFKASGIRTLKGLTVAKADLKLPGVVVRGKGPLLDRRGNFRELTLEVKKTDLGKMLGYIPAAAVYRLSGPVTAKLTLISSKNRVTAHGPVRLAGVSFRPKNAGWRVDGIKGILRVDGDSISLEEISGRAGGQVQGTFSVKGNLDRFASAETIEGKLSIKGRKGRIKATRLIKILNRARLLAGTFLDPRSRKGKGDLLEFDRLSGDFRINSGTVSTENFRFKGPELSAGAIGSLRLPTRRIQALLGLHTTVLGLAAIGRIPGVREAIEKTGIGKELKRFGITLPGSKRDKSGKARSLRTPVTVIVKLSGDVSAPAMQPVLEMSLDKRTAARLKSLMK